MRGRRPSGPLYTETDQEPSDTTQLMPTPIDRNEVRRLLAEEQAQLVEVLPAEEFAEEHLPGAVNIPLKELDRETTRRLDPSKPVIVYCYDYQ